MRDALFPPELIERYAGHAFNGAGGGRVINSALVAGAILKPARAAAPLRELSHADIAILDNALAVAVGQGFVLGGSPRLRVSNLAYGSDILKVTEHADLLTYANIRFNPHTPKHRGAHLPDSLELDAHASLLLESELARDPANWRRTQNAVAPFITVNAHSNTPERQGELPTGFIVTENDRPFFGAHRAGRLTFDALIAR